MFCVTLCRAQAGMRQRFGVAATPGRQATGGNAFTVELCSSAGVSPVAPSTSAPEVTTNAFPRPFASEEFT